MHACMHACIDGGHGMRCRRSHINGLAAGGIHPLTADEELVLQQFRVLEALLKLLHGWGAGSSEAPKMKGTR
jgi:hypothetical protein